MMGFQGEEGRRRGVGIACAVLPTDALQVSIKNTDRMECALLSAHNYLASASNTWPFTFCEAPFMLEGAIRRLQDA